MMNVQSFKVCALLVMTVVLLSSHAWSQPRIVPGQVIIKFSPGSQSADAVAKASRTTPPDLASVKPVSLTLQDRYGVLLKPLRFKGDERMLFSIDVDHATHELQSQLQLLSAVSSVHEALSPTTEKLGASQPKKLKISFVDNSQEFTFLEKRSTSDQPSALLDELLLHLQETILIPLKGEVSESGDLLVWTDLTALTQSVVSQLSQEPEIESAQPNYLLSFR